MIRSARSSRSPRRRLAKTRQEMLASMVMLGMQRIVVDSGRINASMRFHIDTRSAAQEDRGSRFDVRNAMSASGGCGTGIWGASASMQNTIGYVSTQQTQTTEEMNTDLDPNSSVEVVFRSDYMPLDRLASSDQVSRIRDNSRNPAAEADTEAIKARTRRAELAADSDKERRKSLGDRLGSPPEPKPPAPGAAGSAEAPERARRPEPAKDKKNPGTAAKGKAVEGKAAAP